MVNSQGFVGMDKPIGRMETKEQTGKVSMKASNADPNKVKELASQGINVELTEKKNKKKVEKNPFAICTTSLGLEGKKKDDYTKGEDKKFERCVLGVKKSLKEGKNPYEVILEQKMREIVESNLRPTMTKNDLINSILESKTKEKTKEKERTTTNPRKSPFKPAPDAAPKPKGSGTEEKKRTKEKERTTTTPRKNPFQPAPNADPKPKGSGTKEKEKTKEKERTTTNPRKNPFQPAPNTDPRPKGELPKYLSFGKMNIKLKGE